MDVCEEYFEQAEELLGVVSVADETMKPMFHHLQHDLFNHLQNNMKKMQSVYRVIHAPLAVKHSLHSTYSVFSTTQRLLELVMEKDHQGRGGLCILLKCVVQAINRDGGRAVSLKTNQGILQLHDSQLILAMGVIPPTTLLLNSFPDLKNTGKSLGAHFISAFMARIPLNKLSFETHNNNESEFAAVYIAGNQRDDMRRQFHIQLTAYRDGNPVCDTTVSRFAPAQALQRHIQRGNLECEGYVVFCCSALGEVDVRNENNSLRKKTNLEEQRNCKQVWLIHVTTSFAFLLFCLCAESLLNTKYAQFFDVITSVQITTLLPLIFGPL